MARSLIPFSVRQAFLDECRRRGLSPGDGLKLALADWCGIELVSPRASKPRLGRPRKVVTDNNMKDAA